MIKASLHPTQIELLKLIRDHGDNPLTIKAMQSILGVSSSRIISHHLKQLEKKGYIKKNPTIPRDYLISETGPENPVAHIALYGLKASDFVDGRPNDKIAISSKLLPFPVDEAFAFRAEDNSIAPRIYDKDIIIAQRKALHELETIEGKCYACIHNGELIITMIHRDYYDIILYSLNSDFPPIVASGDFKIVGEVKLIISNRI